MTKIYAVYKGLPIGVCHGISGLCVANMKNGIRGIHLPSVERAKKFIDENPLL